MIRYKAIVIFLTGLITLMMFHGAEALSQNIEEKPFDKIFDLIYNQKFGEAETELRTSEVVMEKWGYQLLLLDLHWWKAVTGNSEEDYQNLESVLNEYSARLNNSPDPDDLEELICSSYSLRLALVKNRIFAILANIYRINRIIGGYDTERLTSEQQDVFKIYTALFNIGKSRFLFTSPGLKAEGIKTLEDNLTSPNKQYQTISCYFLSKIYLDIDKLPSKAIIYCEKLCQLYPDNRIFAYNLDLSRRSIKE
ncbi:MAG: hypothetical protein K0B05_03930 [Bacteroidales bacterium]|nr:hypothetical protein [Bacteroidales bacterium]